MWHWSQPCEKLHLDSWEGNSTLKFILFYWKSILKKVVNIQKSCISFSEYNCYISPEHVCLFHTVSSDFVSLMYLLVEKEMMATDHLPHPASIPNYQKHKPKPIKQWSSHSNNINKTSATDIAHSSLKNFTNKFVFILLKQ